MSKITKGALIDRLCALCTKVGTEKFDSQEPHDCFCASSHFPFDFQFSEEILKFVEKAVTDALEEPKVKPRRSKWHRVEDALPDNRRDVCVRLEDGKIIVSWFANKWWPSPFVTHWRELPKFKEERDA